MVAGTSYTRHSKVATLLQEKFVERKSCKKAKNYPISQMKILERSASQKRQISGFWLQNSQSGNSAAVADQS